MLSLWHPESRILEMRRCPNPSSMAPLFGPCGPGGCLTPRRYLPGSATAKDAAASIGPTRHTTASLAIHLAADPNARAVDYQLMVGQQRESYSKLVEYRAEQPKSYQNQRNSTKGTRLGSAHVRPHLFPKSRPSLPAEAGTFAGRSTRGRGINLVLLPPRHPWEEESSRSTQQAPHAPAMPCRSTPHPAITSSCTAPSERQVIVAASATRSRPREDLDDRSVRFSLAGFGACTYANAGARFGLANEATAPALLIRHAVDRVVGPSACRQQSGSGGRTRWRVRTRCSRTGTSRPLRCNSSDYLGR
ncbi:hypothetical protein MRX96_054167 [Rhipicephalus microplus]